MSVSWFLCTFVPKCNYFLRMKDKILAALTAINGQYNFPKEVLERIAAAAPAFESEDKIGTWIDSMKPMFGLMQSYSDSRVGNQQKEVTKLREELDTLKVAQGGRGSGEDKDLEKRLGVMIEAQMSAYKKQIDDLLNANKDLKEKVSKSEQDSKEREFSELKKRVARELGISDALLGLVDGKLTSDMDEKRVNEVLAECKKTFVDEGLRSVETASATATSQEEAQNRAKDFLADFKASQETNE